MAFPCMQCDAPRSPAKLAGFLKCFAADTVELRDLGSGAVKMTATQIATRYGTVFEHSTALRGRPSLGSFAFDC